MNRKSMIFALVMLASIPGIRATASDHDDGELDLKGRALNLTDQFVFKESQQVTGGDATKLVLIMNSNPRSLPHQQYFFSTQALYEFHICLMGTNNDTPSKATDDVTLRFQFGAPDTNNVQKITMTVLKGGSVVGSDSSASTTPVNKTATANAVTIGGAAMTVFAGLREDPFFFDVTQFFKFRADIAASGGASAPAAGNSFPAAGTAVDFTANYNANSIVVRLPITFLSATDTVFDVWSTTSVPR